MFVGRYANNLYPCPCGYSSLRYTADTDSYLIREAVIGSVCFSIALCRKCGS
jgi:hypothetical protein